MIASVLVGGVIVIHLYIVVLEMVLWTRPAGRKAFAMTAEFAESTKVLAANQGLYNGFLAAGLIWGLWRGHTEFTVFFLTCVVVAGIFGGLTVSRKVFLIQSLPAIAALGTLLMGI